MPIEIKELNIKAFINDTAVPQSSLPKGNQSAVGNTESIVAACVEQVLQILKDKEER